MRDIENLADIRIMVDVFYKSVREDDILGPVFDNVIEDLEWPTHLNRMYGFWHTILFGIQDYKGNPFSKHRNLPINKIHFDRWIRLINKAVDENFRGPKADEVKWRADKMSLLFQKKLNYLRSNTQIHNIV